jgi:hypothetical protein
MYHRAKQTLARKYKYIPSFYVCSDIACLNAALSICGDGNVVISGRAKLSDAGSGLHTLNRRFRSPPATLADRSGNETTPLCF